jgi:hypothetical protein
MSRSYTLVSSVLEKYLILPMEKKQVSLMLSSVFQPDHKIQLYFVECYDVM